MGPLSTGPTPGLGKRRPATSDRDPSSANRPSSFAETALTICASAPQVKFQIVEPRSRAGTNRPLTAPYDSSTPKWSGRHGWTSVDQRELVERAGRGDHDAFGQLVRERL